jgi:hypothetical protein
MENPGSGWHDAALNNLYAIDEPDPGMSQIHPSNLKPAHADEPAPSAAGSPEGERAQSSHQERLNLLLAELGDLAAALEDQPAALLDLLRRLEQLHRTIQDGPFRASLPAERNQLFSLLQQMESSGGWPYIPRLQLRTFMDLIQQQPVKGSATPSGPAGPGGSDAPLAA